MKLIDKILEDFSILEDVNASEVDDFQNPIHIVRLKEVMASYGIQDEVINPIIRTITEQDDDDEKVTFKHDGETRTITMKTARQYASDIKQGDDSEEKQAAVKAANLDSKDTKQDKEDDSGKLEPDDFDIEKTGYLGVDKDDSEVEKEEPKLKKLSDKTKQTQTEMVNQLDTIIENETNEGSKKATGVLKDNWSKFVNAETQEERVEAVKQMVDYGLLARNQAGGKGARKVYITSNASGVPYKHFMGAAGNAVTQAISDIIDDEGLEVDMRNSSADRALADLSGKHNEAGVVALIDSSDENQKAYDELRAKYKELGGSDEEAHNQNQTAANMIKESLPDNSTITGAIQVGGIGGKELMSRYGIDEKVDPTDMIVQYKDSDGSDKIMKISAKIYSNPNDITMKNSGTKTAGVDYLGEEIGQSIDSKLDELRKSNNYQELGISDEEQKNRKRSFRESYMKLFGNGMLKLSKTPEGEKRLVQMWKDVHGCGHDVHTLIVNKKTGESQIKPPEHYCSPNPPFKVSYDGGKIVINLETQTDAFVQIDCKTEMKSSPKLLFKHKVKRKK